MKKFKIISTCTSLVLMLALLAFGVYASKDVTLSISGTVSFTCNDVFIKVAAGLGDTVPNNPTYYYSQPHEGEKNISELNTLGNSNFYDEDSENGYNNTISYFVYIENLHNMPIYLMYEYLWAGDSKYNAQNTNLDGAVTVTTQDVSDGTKNITFKNQEKETNVTNNVRNDKISSSTECLVFKEKEVKKLIITLTMNSDAMIYKLTNGSFNLKVMANLDAFRSIP